MRYLLVLGPGKVFTAPATSPSRPKPARGAATRSHQPGPPATSFGLTSRSGPHRLRQQVRLLAAANLLGRDIRARWSGAGRASHILSPG
jgi:hypothetical protein